MRFPFCNRITQQKSPIISTLTCVAYFLRAAPRLEFREEDLDHLRDASRDRLLSAEGGARGAPAPPILAGHEEDDLLREGFGQWLSGKPASIKKWADKRRDQHRDIRFFR
jgi:hypothetical protein